VLRIKFCGGRQFSSPKSPTSCSCKPLCARHGDTTNIELTMITNIFPRINLSQLQTTEYEIKEAICHTVGRTKLTQTIRIKFHFSGETILVLQVKFIGMTAKFIIGI